MTKINHEEYELLKSLGEQREWMARDLVGDYGGDLFAYPEKPFKNHDAGGWVYGRWFHPIDNHLFQFIQWEDEEPHNIDELVEEYEDSKEYTDSLMIKYFIDRAKEIEGTKMSKGIEWLKEQINDINPYTQHTWAWKKKMLELIDQLDESEVLSQELPVVPKFVADWIEVSRKATYHLLGAVYDGAYNEDMKEWLFKGDKRTRQDNQDKLTRAWLDGFTVEEGQKYHALIKGHENIVSDDKYWNYCITDESLDIGDNKVHTDVLAEYVLSATKDDWENLGINDGNADFVEVEGMKE